MFNLRLDKYLVESGLSKSREVAKEEIKKGYVKVDGIIIKKPSFIIEEKNEVLKIKDAFSYVGRGGLKLESAIKNFDILVKDKVCVDIGASTGGFTDCLLLNGAKKVYCFDVGKSQLAKKLIDDNRVISYEKTNCRNYDFTDIEKNVSYVVMDVSFISAKKVLENLFKYFKCEYVVLIKPQFEVGKKYLNTKGVVKSKKAITNMMDDFSLFFNESNMEVVNMIKSPILGQNGNVEFLMHLKYDSSAKNDLNQFRGVYAKNRNSD